MTLNEFRAQYPQYASVNDIDLAYTLYDRNYRYELSVDEFVNRIGFDESQANEFRNKYQSQRGNVLDVGRRFLRGATQGIAENVIAAGQAGYQKITGDDAPYGQLYEQNLARERERMELLPSGVGFGAEALGAAVTGGAILNAGKRLFSETIKRSPNLLGSFLSRPSVQATLGAGASGMIYGTATSEGNLEERIEEGTKMIIPSALFGFAGTQLINVGGPAYRALKAPFDAARRNPTIEALQRAKNTAYELVDDSGIFFGPQDISMLVRRARTAAALRDYDPSFDNQTTSILNTLEGLIQEGTVTLSRLDRVRQSAWRRYQSDNSQVAIRDIIDLIDDTIGSFQQSNELMQVARLANQRYKKAELLNDAMSSAELSASGSGTGGNLVNTYRQAIKRIVNSKDIRFFSEFEQQAMRNLIKGDNLDNAMRTLGRFDPTSGGLTALLQFGAYQLDPLFGTTAVLGAIGRRSAEGRTIYKLEELLELARGNQPKSFERQVYPTLPSVFQSEYQSQMEDVGR